MTARWWRSYADTHRNPKIARLSDPDFRLWHQLLCIAAENDGLIPPLEDLKNLLKRRLDHLSSALKRLVDGRLINPLSVGYEPTNWEERQYKSDTSTERVRKHRAERNVTGNVSVTPPDTDTDTDTEDTSNEVSATAFWSKPPVAVSEQVWKDFKANRKRKRTPNTPTAYGKLENDLARISAQTGMKPEKLLEYATEKGWAAVYVPDELKGRTNGAGSQPTDRTLAAAEGAFGKHDTWTDERPF